MARIYLERALALCAVISASALIAMGPYIFEWADNNLDEPWPKLIGLGVIALVVTIWALCKYLRWWP